jgi:hypothetical protein
MWGTMCWHYAPVMGCKVEGCESGGRIIRGYCNRHYENFRTTGDPIPARDRKRAEPRPLCSVEGCGRPVKSVGMCNRHYENVRLRGTAVPRRDLDIWSAVQAIGWTVTALGCWEWDGVRNSNGYGLFTLKRAGLYGVRAHRLVFEHMTGIVLGEEVLCHHCDNPPCVNPDHLFPGSRADNVADMMFKGRRPVQTTCKHGHDLTAAGDVLVLVSASGRTQRACRVCSRERNARYRARRREAARSLA